MMKDKPSTNSMTGPVWEQRYASGHRQNYPWDLVVSFVFRNAPRDRDRDLIHVLEVGFGSGANLWFAAREGFSVAGIEGSPSAVQQARERFDAEGLKGDLRQGDFQDLPFQDASFDLAFDRGALVCVGLQAQERAINEIHRVLKPGGRFMYNGYADTHSSAFSGERGFDGLTTNIKNGTMVGVGDLCFVSRNQIIELFRSGWNLISVQRKEQIELLGQNIDVHAEWIVVAEKIE